MITALSYVVLPYAAIDNASIALSEVFVSLCDA